MRRQMWRVTVVFAAAWPMVGLISSAAAKLAARRGADVPPELDWLWSLLDWSLSSVLTPAIVWAAVQFPLRGVYSRRNAAFHVGGFCGIAVVHATVFTLIYGAFSDRPLLSSMYGRFFHHALLNYTLVTAVVTVVSHQRRARFSVLARARLERHLAQVQLNRVVMRVDPERILKILESSAERIHEAPADVEATILSLSRELRSKLSHRARSLPPGVMAAAVRKATAIEPEREWLVAWLFPLFATGVSLLVLIERVASARPISFDQIVRMTMAVVTASLIWPVVLWTGRRFAAADRQWRKPAWSLTAACVAQAALSEAVIVLLGLANFERSPGVTFGPVLLLSATAAFLLHHEQFGRRKFAVQMRGREIARHVSEAQLHSLQTQIAPHFLFNVLNSIISLMSQDAVAARRMVLQLAGVLRAVLLHDGRHFITLREEMALTTSYIEIEAIRFQDMLKVEVDVDESLLDEIVPAFLLQPLLENAIRHGVAHCRTGIRLQAGRRCDDLEIVIENDCLNADPGSWVEGIGLSNVRTRLEQLYGAGGRLTIEPLRTHGIAVRIHLPIGPRPVTSRTAGPAPAVYCAES